MTARENKSARDVIIEHVLAMQGNALYTAEEVADGFLAALVGAGLDAHDWLQLAGYELEQVGYLNMGTLSVSKTSAPGWQPVYRLGLRGSEDTEKETP